jgi:hypothetical protein
MFDLVPLLLRARVFRNTAEIIVAGREYFWDSDSEKDAQSEPPTLVGGVYRKLPPLTWEAR